ncbi:homeobox protein knotted-1-like 2 [Lolium rigidum]|uniref:homeobox protein knotted-1-like 2 n=1 Tax=Lolium rigidum TaxID=89674 RepID=UPI001F5DACD5|nr:homeobox protein knotted-1-like 2 [Lolium rigidum]
MSKPRWDGARHAHFPDHGLAMDATATAPSSSNPSFSASGTAAARRGRRRPSAPPHPHLVDPPRVVISSPAVLPDEASAAAANGYGPLGEVHGDLHPHVLSEKGNAKSIAFEEITWFRRRSLEESPSQRRMWSTRLLKDIMLMWTAQPLIMSRT